MVKIYIVDLSIMCLIGIYPEERTKKQKLIFNIEIHSSSIDNSKDDITKTIDYSKIENDIVLFVENSNFFLIETLANEIANNILKDWRVEFVRVRLDKPEALKYSMSAAIEIEKRKSN